MCVIVALFFGLQTGIGILWLIIFLIPSEILFISFGVLFGSLFNVKQVGGFCGAILTNLSAWLSGTWFSLDLLWNGFKTFAYCLPFAKAVDTARYAFNGNFTDIWTPFFIVLAYAAVILVLAIVAFGKRMYK